MLNDVKPIKQDLRVRRVFATETDACRSATLGLAVRGLERLWQSSVFIVKAATVIGWHRKGFRAFRTGRTLGAQLSS